jgi:hypothetical protein
MTEPSWIGSDGSDYRNWCDKCDDRHKGECESNNESAYDPYDMWREMQNDLRDGIV